MNPEKNQIPEWAVRERQADLSWINENLDVFWQTAVTGAQFVGRGAIVVDVVSKPMGSGNYFTYITQADLERFEDADVNRLLEKYEPKEEMVMVLIKPEERTSSYQIRPD